MVLGAVAAVSALILLRCVFLHGLFAHNRSAEPVDVVCDRSVSMHLQPDEQRSLSYAIVGRTFSCVVSADNEATTCGRTLRGLEDVRLTVSPDGELDCDDY